MWTLVAERVLPAVGHVKEAILVLLLFIHGSHGDAAEGDQNNKTPLHVINGRQHLNSTSPGFALIFTDILLTFSNSELMEPCELFANGENQNKLLVCKGRFKIA